MLRRILANSRFIAIVAVAGTFIAAIALLFYEVLVVIDIIIDLVRAGVLDAKAAKVLAVGMIEAVDVFLIAIALYIISLGLYSLFVDDQLPLPDWLRIKNLEDLKGHLVSVVIAVLAVLFLREAVAWDGTRDILAIGAALALVVGALTYYLRSQGSSDR